MSNYKDFIQDFPSRCGIILNDYNQQAKKSDLEVTHMLAIASVAITMPLERLRKPNNGIKHPSNERNLYQSANSKFANLCGGIFIKSKLFNGDTNDWKVGIVEEYKVNNEPESWITNAQIISSDYKIINLLIHLRNSISHANIYTSSDTDNNIINLIFLDRFYEETQFTGKYSYLLVSVNHFNKFLINWIGFLSDELKLERIE